MDDFDFSAPAEVYAAAGWGARRKAMKYRRFDTAAEAIRFAMEGQDTKQLAGTVIESEDARLVAADIRTLYESESYPLPRVVRDPVEPATG